MTNANDPISLGSEVDRMGNPIKEHLGLSKREYFAAIGMQGLLSNPNSAELAKENGINMAQEIIAAASIKLADALIKALNDTP